MPECIGVSHSGAEEKNACSDISDKPVQEKHMYLSGRIGLRSSAALQSSGASHMLSNLPTSDTKSLSVGPDILSDSHRKLASVNQLQTLDQQKNAVTDTDIVCASARLKNQVLFTDSLHQTSAQGGDQSLYNREMTPSREQISSSHADSVRLPSTSLVAKDSKGRKREVCPPGFEERHHLGRKREVCPSKFVSVSSSTCSAMCSTSDTVIQDLCSLTCQSDIISWVSECLDDDGDNIQSNSGSVSSTLSSSDPTWGCKQFPGRLLQRMGGVENTMRCCGAFPPVCSSSNQKPEHWNGSANGYMSTRGYDAFCQNPTSGIKAGTEGTLLQQPSPPTVYHSLINGNADSGFKSSQVDLSYPMYSLFG